jgi:hypothetical protein
LRLFEELALRVHQRDGEAAPTLSELRRSKP